MNKTLNQYIRGLPLEKLEELLSLIKEELAKRKNKGIN